jgi:hypothetical protein
MGFVLFLLRQAVLSNIERQSEMVTQKVNEFIHTATPYVTLGIMLAFSIIGYFVIDEFSTVNSLEAQVVELSTDSEVMKSNRFTSKDGLEVWKEIQLIRVEIAKLSSKIPEKIPPDWFEKKVDNLTKDVDENGKKLVEVLQKVENNTVMLDSVDSKLKAIHENGGGM